MEKGDMDRKGITIERIRESGSKEYSFVEELLTASFPIDEYRPLDEQRQNVESVDSFHMNILRLDKEPIGLLSYWQFDGFVYVEHFAVHPGLRGQGYGRETITSLIEEKRNIVLEVELPEDELTRRRVAFYSRCGLTLCSTDYIQPAYRTGGNEIPMKLMHCGVDMERDFERIRDSIYRRVYNKSI